MSAFRGAHVVAIDSRGAARPLWSELADRSGFHVTLYDCREATRDALREARPDIVLLDWSVGRDPSGWPLLYALSIDAGLQRVPVVIFTDIAVGNLELPDGDESVHILPMPFGLDELVGAVARALQEPRFVQLGHSRLD